MACEPLQHFPAAMSLAFCRKIATRARGAARSANKRLNYRVFVRSVACRGDRASPSEKFSRVIHKMLESESPTSLSR